MTTILSVSLPNHPGSLADVLEHVAQAGINVHAVEAEALGDFGAVHLETSDSSRAAEALRAKGYNVIQAEALELRLPNEPGELAKVARRLADANVNIVSLYGTMPVGDGEGRILLRVNRSEAARKALGVAA